MGLSERDDGEHTSGYVHRSLDGDQHGCERRVRRESWRTNAQWLAYQANESSVNAMVAYQANETSETSGTSETRDG